MVNVPRGSNGAPASRPGRGLVVAVDGPAGSGKSTLARRLAQCAALRYLDTGAMYRAVTYAAMRAGCAGDEGLDAPRLVELVRQVHLELQDGPEGGRVVLDGEDVTEFLRAPEVERLVPRVASIPAVREVLTDLQRRIAAAGGVVVDGRDIGTRVLPDADRKFFVTAAFGVRVERRWRQLRHRGVDVDRERVARELRERDRLDQTRSVGPLMPAPDAIPLDTTALTVQAAVAFMLRECGLSPRDPCLGDGAGEPCHRGIPWDSGRGE